MTLKLCSIASSSSGNCIYVGSENTHILIDAGISAKRIVEGLTPLVNPKDIDGIVITHEHIDHIKGIGVLARKYHIPVYATSKTQLAILANTTLGPIPDGIFRKISKEKPFMIGEIEVLPYPISHDAVDPVCYTFKKEGKKISFATDLGTYDMLILELLKDSDILFLEANHDVNMLMVGSYPYPLKRRILSDFGHLSNVTSGAMIRSLLHPGLKHIVLGHLSKENNYPDLARETIKSEIMAHEHYDPEKLDIFVADRDKPSKLISI